MRNRLCSQSRSRLICCTSLLPLSPYIYFPNATETNRQKRQRHNADDKSVPLLHSTPPFHRSIYVGSPMCLTSWTAFLCSRPTTASILRCTRGTTYAQPSREQEVRPVFPLHPLQMPLHPRCNRSWKCSIYFDAPSPARVAEQERMAGFASGSSCRAHYSKRHSLK